MLKRILSTALLFAALHMGASAQKTGSGYDNGLGFRIDFGSGETVFGFSGKHFFTQNHAGEAQLLFGSGITYIDLEYQYHAPIKNAAGLQWYAGVGPMFGFYSGGSDIFLRPVGGLDYKLNNAPINFSFDWRPTFRITHSSYGDQFTAGRFGLAARYAF
ncbi:MAG TPA: hypothetical protein VFS22_08600 [Flavisolibacter sp.]|nr:hypothetical protein [Flavisolibacter sp.]